MKRWQFLLSYLLSRLIFLFVEMVGLLVFAYYIFGVQVHGSLLSFMLLAVLGSFTFAGIGLLTSARARTVEAAVGIINLITIPMWLLSGSFFSTTRFPEFMQPLVKALPLTALNDSLRAVMNDGASLLATWPQMAVLAAWALVSFVLALKIFRWQ
jgi:ABC-type multidrug transport system permease subunit